ncbi:MAG: hypothetical protein V3S07_10285 [Micropepsaceae bacterium]
MNAAYVREQLAIALRVARFEKDSVRDFDQSFDGFFRSFFGIILCAPLYLLIVLAERRITENAPIELPEASFPSMPPTSVTYIALESLSYLAGWIAFPLAMIFLARLIGASPRYVPFIVAYNWTSCVALALLTIPSALYLIGVIPITGAILLSYPILLFTIVYHWKVAREGLDISALTAVGIVLFDVILGLFIALTLARLRAGLVPIG